MTRDEFWKWMETCPVKDRLVVADEEDYVDISFAVCKDTVSYHVDLTPAKKKNKPQKTYMPDESGHMVEWVGDHPIFVGRWTKADDDDEDGGTHE